MTGRLEAIATKAAKRAPMVPADRANVSIATGVEVFPIPATERVTITSSAAVIRNYVVYDGQGRMVRNGNVNLDRVVLEREGLKAGNYYVELFFDEGSLTKKVILD